MAQEFYTEDMVRQQEKLALTPDIARQRKELLASLALRPGERALDVGAGNGIFARDMKEAIGAEGAIYGIDSSPLMVDLAAGFCPGGAFRQGDATALPHDDGAFDVVTASQLICFVPEPDAAVREMFRVLKPGGRAVILDTDWDSLVWNCRDEALMARAMALFRSPYADACAPRTLSRRLTAAGFGITERRSFTVLNWEIDPDSYAQQTAGFIKAMMADSEAFTDEDWERWSADQAAAAAAGEFMFSLNRYIFRAGKPA